MAWTDGGILAQGASGAAGLAAGAAVQGASGAAGIAGMGGGILTSGVMGAIQAARDRLQGTSILVDTGRMIAKAETVSSAISDVESTFDELQHIMDRTSAYWVGEAGDYHRKMFQNEKDNIIFILTRLKEHPEDLKLMANNFEVAEHGLRDVNRQLRTDYI